MLWRLPLKSKRMYFQNYDYAVRGGGGGGGGALELKYYFDRECKMNPLLST